MKNLIKIFILSIFLNSCHYSKDKLVVENNTTINICYQILLKIKDKKKFYHAGVGLEMKPNSKSSPIIKHTILESMDQFSNDKILYVIYYKVKDRDYVHKNLENIINIKKFRVDKYSLKQLDSLKWVIEYN